MATNRPRRGSGAAEQVRHRRPGQVEHAGEVDLDHRPPGVVVGLPERRPAGDRPGRGHHGVDAAVASGDRPRSPRRARRCRGRRPRAASPAPRQSAAATSRSVLLAGRYGPGISATRPGGFEGQVDEGDGEAPRREAAGGGGTHAPGRAGDDRDGLITAIVHRSSWTHAGILRQAPTGTAGSVSRGRRRCASGRRG